MINISEYIINTIRAPWDICDKVMTSIDVVKRFLGKDLEINHIFISNWLNNNNYEYGDSLWIFTNNHIIECLNYKNIMNDCDLLEFKTYALESAIIFSRITSINYSESSIEIQLPNGESANFRGINGNHSHLISIYKVLINKTTT